MYDLKVTLTLKSVDNSKGWVGIMFRKKDDFNYYSLEISKNWIRFKRLVNGEPKIIAYQALTPAMKSNYWYNLELTAI